MTAPRTTRTRRLRLIVPIAAAFLLAPAPPAFAGPAVASSGWTAVQWALGSQRRMLQVGTVGMCLALYIIMWRK
jgi:hypothetical protein